MSYSSTLSRPPMSSRVRRASHSKASSASCANAKPCEDWTKMTDLVARRRVQNRIAQRNYREKKRLKRAEELRNRALSSSVSPGAVPPASIHTHSAAYNRSPSTDAPAQQPRPGLLEPFPQQYGSMHDNRDSVVNEGYLREPMTSDTISYSYSGYAPTLPPSYAALSQPTSYGNFLPRNLAYADTTRQHQFVINNPSINSTNTMPVTPITPTSQGDCSTPSHHSPYDVDFPQSYQNFRVPATDAQTDSATFVNTSDFLRQNYPFS